MNQCIHGLDLLCWLMASPITEVYGSISRSFHPYNEAEDLGLAVIKFENGASASAEGTVNMFDSSLESERVCIFGENGCIVVGGRSANKIDTWSFRDKKEDDEAVRKLCEKIENVYGNGHTALYADVIDAIKTDRAPLVDARAGAMALELVLAIYKSHKTGGVVNLPLGSFSSEDMTGTFVNQS